MRAHRSLALMWPQKLLLGLCLIAAVQRPGASAQQGLCPFTKAPPTKPTVPFSRCLDANSLSCCAACTDISLGLKAATTNLLDILKGISSQVASILGGNTDTLCEAFSQTPTCEILIEQLICAVNCNPASSAYVQTQNGSYTFLVCQEPAQAVYEACKGLSVSTGSIFGSISIGSVVGDPQQLLSYLFQGFASTFLPGISITAQVVNGSQSPCYSGAIKLPAQPLCCDPLGTPEGCPANLTTNPAYGVESGNLTSASVCRAPGKVPPSPVLLSPPVAASPSTSSPSASPPASVTPLASPPSKESGTGVPPTTQAAPPDSAAPPPVATPAATVNPPSGTMAPATVVPLPTTPPGPVANGSYPLCPFTGAPPRAPLVAPTRCLASAKASCCEACTDLGAALQTVSSSVADVLCKILPAAVCALFPPSAGNAQLCSLFDGNQQCANLLEQMVCAVTCDPEAGNYVSQTVSGYTFAVCSPFAEKVVKQCGNITLPGVRGSLASVLGSDQFLPTLFSGISKAILPPSYPAITANSVKGTTKCYAGPNTVPPEPFCCDPLSVPEACPASAVDLSANPSWAFNSGNTQAASLCRAPGAPSGSPTLASPAPPTPPVTFIPVDPRIPIGRAPPPTGSSGAPPPSAEGDQPPPGSDVGFAPAQPLAPIPRGAPPVPPLAGGGGAGTPSAYPLCPLTGKPPQPPTVPHSRCVAAATMSCCEDCADIGFGLAGVSANVSSILCSLLPGACNLFQGQSGDIQLCSVFVDFPKCEMLLEEMVCVVSCNPDSGNYVSSGPDGYSFSVCASFAEGVYDSCKDLKLPGFTGTLGSVVPDAQTFIGTLFKGVAKVLTNNYTFNAQVVNGSSTCFSGNVPTPPKSLCCDPLTAPASCPGNVINFTANPSWEKFSGRQVNAATCSNEDVSLGPPSPGGSNIGGGDRGGNATSSPPPPDAANAGGARFSQTLQLFAALLMVFVSAWL